LKSATLLGFVLAALAAGPAMAADLRAPVYTKAPVMAPAYNWSGFYFGGNVGWSFGRANTDWTIAGVVAGSTSNDMTGILGGAQAGYNWQSSSWVFGLEADIQATGQKGSSSLTNSVNTITNPCLPTASCPTTTTTTAVLNNEEKLPWFGTFRARLGFTPSDRWLIYATGGLAYGEVDSNGTLTVAGNSVAAGTNTTSAGWTAGGGVEAALWDNWTGRLEYLYVDLGSFANSFVGIAPFTPITTNSRVTDNIIRFGLNYRFGGGPVAARY
jgi:outer membrane immunogenic protein